MANPLSNILKNKSLAEFTSQASFFVMGIARDFWKDGTENPFKRLPLARAKAAASVSANRKAAAAPAQAEHPSPEWHAEAGEISEKMWGPGFVAPGGEAIYEMLIKPLGLTKQMSVLDLSAGLGGQMRKIAADFGAYVTGLEPDVAVAARGMEIPVKVGKEKHDPVEHYEPENFEAGKTVTRIYDAIVARETFYRVKDKRKFFTALAACTKPQAQLSFTDYIINPEDRDKPAVAAWMGYEKNAAPLGLVEMAEAWAAAGFKLQVHDDQTGYYHKEVQAGVKRFALFLGSAARPDSETRMAIARRLQSWVHRLGAMDQGMKFYRFYGMK